MRRPKQITAVCIIQFSQSEPKLRPLSGMQGIIFHSFHFPLVRLVIGIANTIYGYVLKPAVIYTLRKEKSIF